MKSDITRLTFRSHHHYRDVRLQQGRVQVDADWNEQIDIQAHLDETTNIDVIGECGAPIGDVGFAVTPIGTPVTDFALSPGRLYLDGILCEIDGEWVAGTVTGPSSVNLEIGTLDGRPLATPQYIIVQGGGQTVQAIVQTVAAGATVATPVGVDVTLTPNAVALLAAGTPIQARRLTTYLTQPDFPVTPPSLPTAPSQYVASLDVWLRHLTAVDRPGMRERALPGSDSATRDQVLWQVRLEAVSNTTNCGNWQPAAPPDARLRARAEPTTGATPCSVASGGGYIRLENQLYRIEIAHGTDVAPGAETYIWSRDNASMVARLKALDNVMQIVTVDTAGPDDVLGFAPGQYVEISDEERTKLGQRGVLAAIVHVEGTELTVVWPTTGSPPPMAMTSFGTNPTVRRWDAAEATVQAGTWLAIEGGVQIEFSGTTFRTGDYWLIPARTVGGCVEWPTSGPNKEPTFRTPHGIVHHRCALATLAFSAGTWQVTASCVPTFPPLTGMVEMYYVGGDGQECLPGSALPEPLEVGVAHWQTPVSGASVRFTLVTGGGVLNGVAVAPTNSVIVTTDATGVASCPWTPANNVAEQRVEAQLLDATNAPVGLPVHFNANLSTADQVAYTPGSCSLLSTATNVQDAISLLAGVARLEVLGGDGQTAPAGGLLPFPVQVQVISDCGPVAAVNVTFDSTSNGGNGTVGAVGTAGSLSLTSVTVATDASGIASCLWQLEGDANKTVQQLSATLGSAVAPAAAGSTFVFTAGETQSGNTGGGCCDVTVGLRGQFPTIAEAINALNKPGALICICLLPGQHRLGGFAPKNPGHLTISGCGPGTVIILEGPVTFTGMLSVHLRDLTIQYMERAQLIFDGSQDIEIDSCTLLGSPKMNASLAIIAAANRIRITASTFISTFAWDAAGAAVIPLQSANPPWAIAAIIDRMAERLAASKPDAQIEFVKQLGKAATGDLPVTRAAEMKAALQTIGSAAQAAANPPRAKSTAAQFAKNIGGALTAGQAGEFQAAFEMLIRGGDPATMRGVYAGLLGRIVYNDAITIADAKAETDLEDNIIVGYLHLYGTAAPAPQNEIAAIGGMVKKIRSIDATGATLLARGNRVTAIQIDESVAKAAQNPSRPLGVFSRIVASANTTANVPTSLIGGTVTLDGNEWRAMEPAATMAIGGEVVAVANTRGTLNGVLKLWAPGGAADAAANVPPAIIV